MQIFKTDLCANVKQFEAIGDFTNAELNVSPSGKDASATGDAVLTNWDGSPVVVHVDLTFDPKTMWTWGGNPSEGWVRATQVAGTVSGSIVANGYDLLQPNTGVVLNSLITILK